MAECGAENWRAAALSRPSGPTLTGRNLDATQFVNEPLPFRLGSSFYLFGRFFGRFSFADCSTVFVAFDFLIAGVTDRL
jgi:hypothetical protein